jgi:hypothetical protein
LRENLAAAELEIPEEEMGELEGIGAVKQGAGDRA